MVERRRSLERGQERRRRRKKRASFLRQEGEEGKERNSGISFSPGAQKHEKEVFDTERRTAVRMKAMWWKKALFIR